MNSIVRSILAKRDIAEADIEDFLNPDYDKHTHDPYLLQDMQLAVQRLMQAKQLGEKVVIYGDYDIDGLSATTLLLDAFSSFGIEVDAYIPDRFVEGYGLNFEALEKIENLGADVVVTVDCGSVSVDVIAKAKDALSLDIIVTDHHTVGEELPQCVAVVNPKRHDNTYPFTDLAGVGVAFKLVQALQQELDGLPAGQEKWLLDLVALGTVCDVVDLRDENRAFVHFGLRVLRKTRRPGLSELLKLSGTAPDAIDTTTLGFRVGPRLNASGRLTHAKYSLEALAAQDEIKAQESALQLDAMNQERRSEQKRILHEALEIAEKDPNPVLVIAGEQWSHGIIGIVAAKLLEQFAKPTFVLELLPKEKIAKGSARSFGGFEAVQAVRLADYRISGGGHAAAAGITLRIEDVDRFRTDINEYYHTLGLENQHEYLATTHDVEVKKINTLDLKLIQDLSQLAPFGRANPKPIFLLRGVELKSQRSVGADKQHLQVELTDNIDSSLRGIAFNQSPVTSSAVDALVELQESSYRPGTVECIVREIHPA